MSQEILPPRVAMEDILAADVPWLEALGPSLDTAMRAAIEVARTAPRPYGAAMVDLRSGDLTAVEATEPTGPDVTAHAEINALRAVRRAGVDTGTQILVTTAEPCAMCAGAAAWAKVQAVIVGTTIERLNEFGWKEFYCPPEQLARTAPFRMGPWIVGYLASETDPLYSGHPPQFYGIGARM